MNDIKDAAGFFRERDEFLIISHHRPDGDSLCSSAALCSVLNAAGKRAYCLENPEVTSRYIGYVEKYNAPRDFTPSCVVSVDTADEKIIQINARNYIGKIDLAIDHHVSNSYYASNTFLMNRSSCGELIYLIALELCGSVSKEAATLMYIAAATDTGCFRYKNTTAETLKTAAALVEAGAPNGDLNKKLFMTVKKSRLLLDSLIIEGLNFHMDGELVIASITREMLEKTGAAKEDLEDIAVVAGQIEGIETSITISELEEGGCKVSVRTVNYANACNICKTYGGGGHALAAGCSLDCDIESAKKLMLKAATDEMKGIFN